MRRFGPARRLVIVGLLLGVLAGMVAATPATAATSAMITASSTAPGLRAESLSRSRPTRAVVWRSENAAAGVTLTWTFSRRTAVDGTRLEGAGAGLRITDARLEFSDGSTIALRTDAAGDRSIRFSTRTVRWVHLVVVRVAAGQKVVGLTSWTLDLGSRPQLGRTRGNAASAGSVVVSAGHATGARGIAAASASTSGGQWVQVGWRHPVELAAVRIYGHAALPDRTVRSGHLVFSDGSRIIVGALEPRGGAPTTIAFTPRVVSTVRFVATQVAGTGGAAIAHIAAYTAGSIPPPPTVETRTFSATATPATSCAGITATGRPATLRLLCPSNGSLVGRTATLVIAGPAGARLMVQAYKPRGSTGSIATIATGTIGSSGTGRLAVPMSKLQTGPTAVRVTTAGLPTPLYVQLVNSVGVRTSAPATPTARGMTLVYDDGFDAPLSVTRSGAGAVYASGKPNSYGVDDFGDAIFAQPTTSRGNLAALKGGYLRVQSRALKSGEADPAGYGRRYVGGLISSAHLGGSGFSAQYGYFEARMLGPAGAGTWPAFWLLSTGSLTRPGASTAEIDATELYGQNPRGGCQTAHSWVDRRDVLGKGFCAPLMGQGDWALSWHTYGARVTPTGTIFTIDGTVTARAPAVVDNDQPFFFLANLAIGGGWPIDLSGTDSKLGLYVDWVRVWV